jgi:hypothetical protein
MTDRLRRLLPLMVVAAGLAGILVGSTIFSAISS